MQIEQIDAAGLGHHLTVCAWRGEQRRRLLDRCRINPFESVHWHCPLRGHARESVNTFAGVSGSVRMRLPVAL